MKEFVEKLIEKIKVTSLEIIVTGTKDKPYFEIKYKVVGKEDYNIGYSSYDLNNVLNWKEDCFEIVNQLAEEYNNDFCEWKGIHMLGLYNSSCQQKSIVNPSWTYCPYCGKKIKVVEPYKEGNEE